METAVVQQRTLGSMVVRQNTKTGMFNANDLLKIYNAQAKKPKRIDFYLRTQTTQEYIEVVLKYKSKEKQERLVEADISNTSESRYLKLFDLQAMCTKSDILYTNRGSVNGGTWMDPLLFIDFAMWLSPEYKLYCIKWLKDRLIDLRNDAGDSYKEVTAALYDTLDHYSPQVFKDEAEMLNQLVFGNPRPGQRNKTTEQELALLDRLQKVDANLIRKGLLFSRRVEELVKIKELLTL